MTQNRQALAASKRTVLGRQTKQLRTQGMLPGNVYAKGEESVALSLDAKEFIRVYKEAGETALIDLSIEGDRVRPVLVRDVARHPVSGAPLHVDFHQVNLKEKIEAMIPVETVGESDAVKGGGVLVMAYNEIEVKALPTDLPDHFEVDLTKLAKIGDNITVADLEFDRTKVEIQLDADDVIATVQEQEEEVVVEPTTEPVEVELTKQGATKDEEEAAPAEKKE